MLLLTEIFLSRAGSSRPFLTRGKVPDLARLVLMIIAAQELWCSEPELFTNVSEPPAAGTATKPPDDSEDLPKVAVDEDNATLEPEGRMVNPLKQNFKLVRLTTSVSGPLSLLCQQVPWLP